MAKTRSCDGVKKIKKKRPHSSSNAEEGDLKIVENGDEDVALKNNNTKTTTQSRATRVGKKKKKTKACPRQKSKVIVDNNSGAAPVTQPPFPLYSLSKPLKDCQKKYSFQEALSSVATLLKSCNNIVVMVGAGISVSCGIPDFRSKDTGLYSTLDAQSLGLTSPEELFDLESFNDDPQPFYTFARQSLYPPNPIQPSFSHFFLSSIHDKLLRIYTQNIDGLEMAAGLSQSKVVHAHGNLQWSECLVCQTRYDSAEVVVPCVRKGIVPTCTKLVPVKGKKGRKKKRGRGVNAPENEQGRKRVSSRNKIENVDNAISNDLQPNVCGGVIKPGVTFFGEKLADEVGKCLEADHSKADALIVMGTSLSVAPMSKIIKYLPPSIPRILINRNIVKPPPSISTDEEECPEKKFRDGYTFDACLLGFCDDVTRALAKKMNLCREQDNGVSTDLQSSLPSTPTETKKTKTMGEKNCHSSQEDEEEEETVLAGQILSNVTDSQIKNPSSSTQIILPHSLHQQPPERVLLFPGAALDNSTLLASDCDDLHDYHEVASCDECGNQIKGTIMKCTSCFDYDLCTSCYPDGSKKHSNGKHIFLREEQTKEVIKK